MGGNRTQRKSRARPCHRPHPPTETVVNWCCQPFQNAHSLSPQKSRSSACPGVSDRFSCRDPFFLQPQKKTFWPSWPSAAVSATFLGFFWGYLSEPLASVRLLKRWEQWKDENRSKLSKPKLVPSRMFIFSKMKISSSLPNMQQILCHNWDCGRWERLYTCLI